MIQGQHNHIKVLAVDDNEDLLFSLEQALKHHGFEVITASCGQTALDKAEAENPDIILLDINMPGIDGYQVTQRLKQDRLLRYIPIILLTAKEQLEDIIKGFELGADDYIKKPFEHQELAARLNAALRTKALYRDLEKSYRVNRQLQEQLGKRFQFENIIGKSAIMQEVYSLIEKVADSDVPVLINGESGTGKELVASAIHFNSTRRDKPFVVQNCSAFNDNLLESELFGHVKGAFTGAISDKEGLFTIADGGTFFLDELGEMSSALQVKLLRVLQDGTFTPVGSTKTHKVNVRILAATNRNLRELVRQGEFREDLFYRLNVVSINLPALRERRVDIPLLIDHFLSIHGNDEKSYSIAPDAVMLMSDYAWPGNIRELENEISRLIVMGGNATEIGVDLISPHILSPENNNARGRRLEGDLKQALENLEKNMILAKLEETEWNKSKAATELGISRSNLVAKVQSYGLKRSR